MKSSALIFSLSLTLLLASPVSAKVYLTQKDALKQAFPDADRIERLTIFLNKDDVKRIEHLSRAKVASKIFTYYAARGKDNVLRYAVFESYITRAKPEVFMAVITSQGEVDRIEMLAFYDSEEHMPPKRWLQLFKGKRLDDQLQIKKGISAITGATMTAEGITSEIRKILAVFELKILALSR